MFEKTLGTSYLELYHDTNRQRIFPESTKVTKVVGFRVWAFQKLKQTIGFNAWA